jgi:peptidase M50B-like protein
MLYLIRKSFSPNKILTALGIFVGAMLLVFTVVSPIFNFLSLQVAYTSILFTIITGGVLTAGLIALGIFADLRLARFAVSFLAVQCLLNAIMDQMTLFAINSPFASGNIPNDAANMATATHLPGIMWVVIWIGISVAMISLGLRLYAVNKARATSSESVFED